MEVTPAELATLKVYVEDGFSNKTGDYQRKWNGWVGRAALSLPSTTSLIVGDSG